jgi:IS5 family transposase
MVFSDVEYTDKPKQIRREKREIIWQLAERHSIYCARSKRSLSIKAKRKVEYCNAQAQATIESSIMTLDPDPARS